MKLQRGMVALVTGASKGIGVHIAQALARRELRLVLVARSEEKLREVQHKVEALGAQCTIEPMDVTHTEAATALIQRLEAEHDGLDLLINNAGVLPDVSYERMPPEEIGQVMDINLLAPMMLTRAALPGMLERDRGHIVNMSSLAGLGGHAHGEAYCASKHGLVGFTRALRASLSCRNSQVSASAICPGYITDTGMFARGQELHQVAAPGALGTSPPNAVVAAVIRAIEKDLPEVIVNSMPIRPALAMAALFPRFAEKVAHLIGVHRVGSQIADATGSMEDG